ARNRLVTTVIGRSHRRGRSGSPGSEGVRRRDVRLLRRRKASRMGWLHRARVGVGNRTLLEVLVTVSHLWEELTSAQLADRLAADPDCVALIPVGATEQHGPHLPVGTDTIIATALADAAAGETAVVLPPLAFGSSFF